LASVQVFSCFLLYTVSNFRIPFQTVKYRCVILHFACFTSVIVFAGPHKTSAGKKLEDHRSTSRFFRIFVRFLIYSLLCFNNPIGHNGTAVTQVFGNYFQKKRLSEWNRTAFYRRVFVELAPREKCIRIRAILVEAISDGIIITYKKLQRNLSPICDNTLV
jgi:hypothetical protein